MSKSKLTKAQRSVLTPAQKEALAIAKAAHDTVMPTNKTEPKLKSNKLSPKATTKKPAKKKSTKKSTDKPKAKAKAKKLAAKPAKAAKPSKKKEPLKANPHDPNATPKYKVSYQHLGKWYDAGEYAHLDDAAKRLSRLKRNLYKDDLVNLQNLETRAAANYTGTLEEAVQEDLPPGSVKFPDRDQKYDKYKSSNGNSRKLPAVIAAEGHDYSAGAGPADDGPNYEDHSAEYND